ncbi:MAG: hypothetical protein HKN13_14310, partial [Rhodothermales bacterium]|nr:hypothetical protein [Rhodothermales bacterium]
VQLFFVRFGRYVHNLSLARRPGKKDRDRLSAALKTFFDPNQLRPVRYNKPEVDEIRILLTWMYANRASTEIVHWHPQMSTESLAGEIIGIAAPIEERQTAPRQIRSTIEA